MKWFAGVEVLLNATSSKTSPPPQHLPGFYCSWKLMGQGKKEASLPPTCSEIRDIMTEMKMCQHAR